MFNSLMNGADANKTNTAMTKTKPIVIDESIFNSFDMDDVTAPSTKKAPGVGVGMKPTVVVATGNNVAKKDILDDLFQDELFANLGTVTTTTTTTAPTNNNPSQPIVSKAKPTLARRNSTNRYEDIFSGAAAAATDVKPAANNKDANMDWLGALENEGSFLTRYDANSSTRAGALRRSRFLPSGKRDLTSAKNSAAIMNPVAVDGGGGGGGWTQTPFKLSTGPTSTVNGVTSPPDGYVPSFAAANSTTKKKSQTDKKSKTESKL